MVLGPCHSQHPCYVKKILMIESPCNFSSRPAWIAIIAEGVVSLKNPVLATRNPE